MGSVVNFFVALERNGYKYIGDSYNPGRFRYYMPNGDQRDSPVIYSRGEESGMVAEANLAAIVTRAITRFEVTYDPERGEYGRFKVTVERRGIRAPVNSPDAKIELLESVIGYFDREFNGMENSEVVLQSLGIKTLSE